MKEPQDHKKKSIKDVIASARPQEKSVTLCLAGDLVARVEDLERELVAAMRSQQATLGGNPEEKRIAAEIESLREQMAEHQVKFTFRALSAHAFSDLVSQHPGRKGKDEGFNVDTFTDALIAACCVEPAMTTEEATELGDALTNAQFSQLWTCAWSVNQTAADVPFSVLASKVLHESEKS